MTLDQICDVIIPAYNEKDYIDKTLYSLAEQTLYKKGKVNIVVGDYKDDLNMDERDTYEEVRKYEYARYMPVFRKGISYARNHIISTASKTDIIINFDADSIFNRSDAIEKMITPVLKEGLKLTNCECILYDFSNKTQVKHKSQNLYEFASIVGSSLERTLFARGPGLTIKKEAFYKVGGFRDVPVGEDYFMAFDICSTYTVFAKRFIEGVSVLTSDRRAKALNKDGLKIFDYQANNYR
jgi:glycosyltransferase involved in cell wall biosynthesis